MYQIYSKPLCFLRDNERMYNVVAPCKQHTLFVFIPCKSKGEVHPRTGHEGQEGEMRYSSTLYLSSALDRGWVVKATLRPLYPLGKTR
jgi:hypothetical protein